MSVFFLASMIWHLFLAHDVEAAYASCDACQKGHRQDRGGRGRRQRRNVVLDQV